ncbi:hypothetical protein ABZ806_01290 [Spirillospora sp. NPDC047418]
MRRDQLVGFLRRRREAIHPADVGLDAGPRRRTSGRRLTDDERDHLFHLAGHRPQPADGVARLARAGLMRMLDLLGDTPALVLSDLGEVLARTGRPFC